MSKSRASRLLIRRVITGVAPPSPPPAQALDHVTITASDTQLDTTDAAPALALHGWQTGDESTPYTAAWPEPPVWSTNDDTIIGIDSATGACTMEGGTGDVVLRVDVGELHDEVTITVEEPAPLSSAPATVTPSNVTARGTTLTIAAPTDAATNPVDAYNIYRNGALVDTVAYASDPQVYSDTYINSPPNTLGSSGEPHWTWSVSAVRGGVESDLTTTPSTLVPIDGWRGDDVPASGVLWSDEFQYADVAALNAAYGTSYTTSAAIDDVVTYNGRPTVKMSGDKRPPTTRDFHTTPSTDVMIRQVTNRGNNFTLNQTRSLFSLHYDDGGTSLEAYNAGGDGGNYVALLLNGAQFLVYAQAKTAGGASVAALTLSSVNKGPSTLLNIAQTDRRFWDLALRLTAIPNGIRIRLYAGLESTDAGAGGGLQLIYDSGSTLADAANVTGAVQIKSASFNSSTDNAQAGNTEWFAVRDIVDLAANPTAFGTLPTVVGYAPPPAPAPVPFGVLSFGPNGISSSVDSPLITPVTIESDADFRALWTPENTHLCYSGNTDKLGTAAAVNPLVGAGVYNFDLIEVDTGTTYVDRDGQTKHTLHMRIVPSFFSDTDPFLPDGVTLNPANDTHPAESHTAETAFFLPSGRSWRSWFVRRPFKFKSGWNMAAANNTASNSDYGAYTLTSGGTGVAQVAGVTEADALKGLVFGVTAGTGANGGAISQKITSCDAAGNITFQGYNGASTLTLDADSVLHIVGFNYTQSSAYKLGPHPGNNNTRADLEMSNSTAALNSGNMTGTSGIPSERYNGGGDSNYTIAPLTTMFGPDWATVEEFLDVAIAFRVTSETTATLKVWSGLLSDAELTLQYAADVTFDPGAYQYMSACNMTGKNFNRQLAASDPTPEWWMGDTQWADLEEAGWAWPSYIPAADQF